ncbi:MAG: ABC transporter ATP-binding protein [Ignavibacteriales bacterium CG12_big_fil_rev_8_21_14_0_65_30_8]|nr:MAG: ABC transporter ATP-binding protein [Ignavibacteriales bacterium CG12_big_fil_rev_8_21_14_0_65_30_8]
MKNLYTLKKYFVRYKKKLFLGILFILLSNIGTVYIPLFLRDAINGLQNQISLEKLLYYCILIIGASAVAGFFRFLIRETIIVVSREIEFDLRKDFWKHIQKLPLRYFQNNSTGNVMAHATNDINAVRTFLGPAVMYSLDTSVRLIIVISIMISLNFSLTIYSLLPLPILSFLVYKVSSIIHFKFTKIQEKFSELTTKAQENFSGIRVVKSYVREENEILKFNEISKDYLKKNMNLVKTQALFYPLLFLITGLSIIIVIWLGGIKVIENQLDLGEITAFIVYLGILIWPMIAFGWVINIIQQGEASMKRLNKIYSEPFEITDSENTDYSIKDLKGDIEFKDVTFKYGNNLPKILDGINLKIPHGSTLAIMGFTGAGKTSLINLIPRLYDCTEGKILIDGKNIKEIPLNILRSNIGLVQQEAFLFSDTIKNNLSYGLDDFEENKIFNAAKLSNLDEEINSFPNGYETIMGERGITLSGGQKQRASLARALVTNPQILILDDSFSAVDTHTEEQILKNLIDYTHNRTTIIISHRISTVKNADKIIVLNNSKIVEEGTHDQLLAKEGIYSDLHFKQLLEKELEEI